MLAWSEPPGFIDLARGAGAPLAELASTPLGARACAMALAAGHDFVHHELRVPSAPALELDEGDDAGAVLAEPRWLDGVLEVDKYAQARLEAPLATYDPNHRAKWRAHELLHRRVGFFWRPDQTPFESYLGARLAELLPVVHWYGFDEAGRQRCPAHREFGVFRESCTRCARAPSVYWSRVAPDEGARARVARCVADALEHFARERHVIDREFATGRRISSPRGPLDASSDASAYARAHWARHSHWTFGAWVELFCTEGVDYQDTVGGMASHVDAKLRELLVDEIELDPVRARRLRERHAARELGFRALSALAADDDPGVEAMLWPRLEAVGTRCAQVSNSTGQDSAANLAPEVEALRTALGELAQRREGAWGTVAELGAAWPEPGTWGPAAPGLRQVAQGLASGLPDTLGREPIDDATALAFVVGDAFRGPGELRTRFLAHAGDELDEATRLEHFVRARPHVDEEADAFGVIPDIDADVAPLGRLRPHSTFRTASFTAASISRVLGWSPSTPHARLGRVFVDGSARVFELDEELAAAMSWLEEHHDPDAGWQRFDAGELAPAVLGLIEARAWVWLAQPR